MQKILDNHRIRTDKNIIINEIDRLGSMVLEQNHYNIPVPILKEINTFGEGNIQYTSNLI